MKIDPDDPKLTAYALDELAEPERSVVAAAIGEAPEAQAFVRQTQQLARMLRGDFQQELHDADVKPLNIMPLPEERASWPETRWSSLALAVVLAVGTIVAALVVGPRTEPGTRAAGRSNLPPLQMDFEVPPDTLSTGATTVDSSRPNENPFVPTASNRVSTFPLRVGGGSYHQLQRQIESGIRPARDTVRIDELINHFKYDYPAPQEGEAFAIAIEASTCPWQTEHQLIRVGVKAKEQPPEGVIATDAAVEVRFDPARVAAYRLIGYERHTASGQNRNREQSAGREIPAGYTATALYQVVPVERTPAASAESPVYTLVDVRLSYRATTGSSRQAVVASFDGAGHDFEQASRDFRFAAAVAQFGMILRDSPHRGSATIASVTAWAREAIGTDQERAGFLQTLQKAERILF